MKTLQVIKRVTLVVISLAAVTTAVLLLGRGANGSPASGGSGGLTTTTLASNLIPASGSTPTNSVGPATTLPPSHDNDAGHSRIHDQYPDADVDWYQWH